jgi:hypothetical protein
MRRAFALLFQVAIGLVGMGVLAFMLWEPHIEGRNAQATLFEVYLNDPFLAYVYLGSTPFFVGLYRLFGLLGDFRRTGVVSSRTVDSLRCIRSCALALIGFVLVGAVVMLMSGDREDRPVAVAMSLFFIMVPGAVAAASGFAAHRLGRA